jgi:hypothetical protein
VGLDGAGAPPVPVLDRSLVADPDDLLGQTPAGMSRLSSGPLPLSRAQETEKSFPLMQNAVRQLGTQRPSSFMTASELQWVCLLRSRSVGVEQPHVVSAESRSRLAPPLPPEYFGNCAPASWRPPHRNSQHTVAWLPQRDLGDGAWRAGGHGGVAGEGVVHVSCAHVQVAEARVVRRRRLWVGREYARD